MGDHVRSRTAFVILVVYSAALVSALGVSSKPNGPPYPALAADSRNDFIAHCSTCHGPDGRGQTPKGRKTDAPDLTKSTASEAKGIRMITNGRGEMPAFKDKLAPDQIRALMAYVRGLRR